MSNLQDVLSFISNDAKVADLDLISKVVRARYDQIRTVSAALVRPDSRVVIKNISPKVLSGKVGTVKEVYKHGKYAIIELDVPVYDSRTRFYGKKEVSGIPTTCLFPL